MLRARLLDAAKDEAAGLGDYEFVQLPAQSDQIALPELSGATLRMDRWAAGSRLMQSADPGNWKTVIAASQLWRGNQKALEACLKAADRFQKPQACKVTVGS